MKHHPAWLAAGLLVFVILACNLGKKSNVNNRGASGNSNSSPSEVDLGPGLLIKEIHMAKDDGNGTPGEETDMFEPGDRTIHCVTRLKTSKPGTQMRFSWWIVDSGDTQNTKINDIEYKTKAGDNLIHGHLTMRQDWPVGKYKVQVYVNGDLDRTVFYTVR